MVSAERCGKGAPRRGTFSEFFVALSLVVLLLGAKALNPYF
jgi:hypothetical protein